MMTEEQLRKKKMALFFTEGVSLKNWAEAGILSREAAFYSELSRYLSKIYFLTYGKEEDQQYQPFLSENIEVVPILSNLGEQRYRERLEAIVKESDFLKTHQVKGADLALRLGKRNHRPVIVRSGYIWSLHHLRESRNFWAHWRIAAKEKRIFKECDAILCTSTAGLNHARRLCEDRAKPIEMIPNCVDTDCFKPLGVEKKRKSLILVGRLVPQKNLLALLRALEGLSCSLTLVGDGPLKKDLFSLAARKKIMLKYHRQIPNEELPLLLNQHEVFVLPSLYEGMPKALLEGMACGLCAVASEIDGVTDVIKDKINGRLCSTSYRSIHDILKELLQAPELVKQYGREARLTVERSFSLQRVVAQEIEFYKNVLC